RRSEGETLLEVDDARVARDLADELEAGLAHLGAADGHGELDLAAGAEGGAIEAEGLDEDALVGVVDEDVHGLADDAAVAVGYIVVHDGELNVAERPRELRDEVALPAAVAEGDVVDLLEAPLVVGAAEAEQGPLGRQAGHAPLYDVDFGALTALRGALTHGPEGEDDGHG